ncbi:hypothetical protein C0995_009170 [Termitomyces sp. Mi166|nr:hypothetical protein C0995_009170 [Termitomyces sp. Mi166\
MAPTLRSSAPNTPNSKSTGLKTPSSVTPRKAHTCTKCKRPKAGHPRSGCPYTDSQTTAEKELSAKNAGQTIVDALGSMNLQSPSREADDDTRATIRQRRRQSSLAAALITTQSVISLDTETQELVDGLVQPGILDNSPEGGRTPTTADKVGQWQEALTPARSTRKRVKMPGSLSSPSPDSSYGSIKLEEPSPPVPINITDDEPITTPTSNPAPSTSIPTVQPLSRSMSMEQRETFLSNLNNNSDATIYLVPRDDIHNIQADAIKVGFYVRVVLEKDTSAPQGDLLVLGRNEAAVKRLHEQLKVEHKQSRGFRAATAGAVVGAKYRPSEEKHLKQISVDSLLRRHGDGVTSYQPQLGP